MLGPGGHRARAQGRPGRRSRQGHGLSAARSCPTPISRLSNYTANLRHYGYTDADIDDGGSDRLIEPLVSHGSPDIIAAGLRSHLDAGANHVAIQVLAGNGNDPVPAYRQLARVLAVTQRQGTGLR